MNLDWTTQKTLATCVCVCENVWNCFHPIKMPRKSTVYIGFKAVRSFALHLFKASFFGFSKNTTSENDWTLSHIEPKNWAGSRSSIGFWTAVLGSFQASERVVPIFAPQKVPSPCLPSDATTAAPSTAVVTPPSCAAPIAAVAYQKIRPSNASRRDEVVLGWGGDGWMMGWFERDHEMICLKIHGTWIIGPSIPSSFFFNVLTDQIWLWLRLLMVVAYIVCFLCCVRCCLLEWNMSCRSCSSVVTMCSQKAVKLLHRRNCIVQVRNMVDASSQRDLREASVYQTFMLPNLDSHTG